MKKPKIDLNAEKKLKALGPNKKFPYGIEVREVSSGHVSFERYPKERERDQRLKALAAGATIQVTAVAWSRR